MHRRPWRAVVHRRLGKRLIFDKVELGLANKQVGEVEREVREVRVQGIGNRWCAGNKFGRRRRGGHGGLSRLSG